MTTTITYSGGTLTPELVDGYQGAREARNVEHVILGRAGSDFTLRPAALRSGTLRLLFPLEADAAEALDALSAAETFALTTDERTTLDMEFVTVDAGASMELDNVTRRVWIVSVPFQEVTP